MFLVITPFSSAFGQSTQVNINENTGVQVFYPKFKYVQQNSEFTLFLHTANLSDGKPINNNDIDCYVHLYNPDGSHTMESGVLSKDSDGTDHFVNVTSGNLSELGLHSFFIWCNNSDIGGSADGVFMVTLKGGELSIEDAIIRIILLLFFISLFLGFSYMQRNINFKKWYDRLLKEYEEKNIVKMVLGALTYNFMKHSFFIYYMLGLPVLMMITNIAYTYGILAFAEFIKVLLYVYASGLVIVGLVFLSYVQEWIAMMLDTIKKMDWGME